jgi:hypothetical protein
VPRKAVTTIKQATRIRPATTPATSAPVEEPATARIMTGTKRTNPAMSAVYCGDALGQSACRDQGEREEEEEEQERNRRPDRDEGEVVERPPSALLEGKRQGSVQVPQVSTLEVSSGARWRGGVVVRTCATTREEAEEPEVTVAKRYPEGVPDDVPVVQRSREPRCPSSCLRWRC